MKPMTKAWAVKAEADLATAEREVKVTDDPNYDGVCYHAKECALNYLKARLEEAEIPFPITSHLVVLLELCLDLEPGWESYREHLRFLTTAANQSLEAESRTNRKAATQAVEMARAFRDEVRGGLVRWAPVLQAK
jgi:HEPN domain-containing protein